MIATLNAARTWYVASLGRYVLVDAGNEGEASRLGLIGLQALSGRQDIQVHTVRLASMEELELQRWHDEMMQQEAALAR